MVVEERGDGLVFELGYVGVGPVEDGEPGYVGERHDAAWVGLAGDADGDGELIGESVALDVTGGAGAFAVGGQSQVVEEVAAEFHLGGGHGIVGGDGWWVEARWEGPLVFGLDCKGGYGAEKNSGEDLSAIRFWAI